MDTSGGGFARNELTLSADLVGKTGVQLRFWVKEFNDETHNATLFAPFSGGLDFDGVAVSSSGSTWYPIYNLTGLTNNWQEIVINMDSAIVTAGMSYSPNFKIRFNQYDNTAIPDDGFAFDDIVLTAMN